jgi:renalase
MQDILVIGAGVAGLTAARALSKAGRDVLVLEKSRGLGGRSATRSINGAKVDHGAQYFTVRDKDFQKQVDIWLEKKHLEIWSRGFHRLTDKGLEAPTSEHPRYVFPNGMNTIGKLLGEGSNIRTQTKVTRLRKKESHWLVLSGSGETFEAHTVILNMPAEQALALCTFDLGSIHNQLQGVVMEPCFALMLGYDKSFLPSWQGVQVDVSSSPVAWIARDSSKRTSFNETVLVAHSTPAFAREHFDEDLEAVKTKLLASLTSLPLSPLPQPLWRDIQRWKYALASQHLAERFLGHEASLYFCGDWCGGKRLEAAYLSGLALAKHLGSKSG